MTTGMIKPSWSFADVFALNCLQKSMMFTPCWPRAGPTGGAGVALPAGICNFTYPITFFAILVLFHLEEVEFNRRGPAEDRHHDFQRVPVGIHVVHDAVKIGERTIDDPDVLSLFECQFRLGPVRRSRDFINNLLDLLIAKGRWALPGTNKSRHPRSVLHGMPCLIAGFALLVCFHLDENVTGIEHLLRDDALPTAYLNHLFGRYEYVVDLRIEPKGRDAALQALGNLSLESRVGMNDVPEFCHFRLKLRH